MTIPTEPAAYLVLDASTRDITVGVVRGDQWEASRHAAGDALETLFGLTREALSISGRTLADLQGVLFCAGPGSLLGLRLAAMATATWITLPELAHWQLRQYHSLEFVAHGRLLAGETDFHVLSPFRRDRLNHLAVIAKQPREPDVVSVDELESLSPPCYFVQNGTLRTSRPENVSLCEYSLDELPAVFAAFPQIFHPARQPEIHLPIAPTFARWSAERHRG